MFSSSLKGPTSHDQMNMNQNKFRYCTSLAYHPKIHWNAVNNIYLNQNVLGVDLQLCLCFTECNQCCPYPVGPTVGRLWAPQTNRMQSTTWVQRQINSNSLIFVLPTCVVACAAQFWSPQQNLTPRFLEKLAALRHRHKHTQKHTQTQTQKPHTQNHTPTHTHTHRHTQTTARTHSHTHLHTPTDTDTQTDTHPHTKGSGLWRYYTDLDTVSFCW